MTDVSRKAPASIVTTTTAADSFMLLLYCTKCSFQLLSKWLRSPQEMSEKAQLHSKLDAFKKAWIKSECVPRIMKGCSRCSLWKEMSSNHIHFSPLFNLSYCYVSPDGSQDGGRPDAQHEQFLPGLRSLPLRLWRPETVTRQWRWAFSVHTYIPTYHRCMSADCWYTVHSQPFCMMLLSCIRCM